VPDSGVNAVLNLAPGGRSIGGLVAAFLYISMPAMELLTLMSVGMVWLSFYSAIIQRLVTVSRT